MDCREYAQECKRLEQQLQNGISMQGRGDYQLCVDDTGLAGPKLVTASVRKASARSCPPSLNRLSSSTRSGEEHDDCCGRGAYKELNSGDDDSCDGVVVPFQDEEGEADDAVADRVSGESSPQTSKQPSLTFSNFKTCRPPSPP